MLNMRGLRIKGMLAGCTGIERVAERGAGCTRTAHEGDARGLHGYRVSGRARGAGCTRSAHEMNASGLHCH